MQTGSLRQRLRQIIRHNKILTRSRRALRKSYCNIRYFYPMPREARYVVVITQERTGSTLFMDLLACHPTIFADPHKFYAPETWPRSFRKGRRVFSRKPMRCYKFKIANAPAGPPWSPAKQAYLRKLGEDRLVQTARAFLQRLSEEATIIRLKRENTFRQALSKGVVGTTGVLHYRDEAIGRAVPTLRVNVDRVIGRLDNLIQLTAFEEKVFEGVPHLTVIYEKDLRQKGRHQATMDLVFNFLELPPHPVRARTSPTSKRNAPEYIKNYQELVEVMKNKGYGCFLPNGSNTLDRLT